MGNEFEVGDGEEGVGVYSGRGRTRTARAFECIDSRGTGARFAGSAIQEGARSLGQKWGSEANQFTIKVRNKEEGQDHGRNKVME
jgi:hypothetical protein